MAGGDDVAIGPVSATRPGGGGGPAAAVARGGRRGGRRAGLVHERVPQQRDAQHREHHRAGEERPADRVGAGGGRGGGGGARRRRSRRPPARCSPRPLLPLDHCSPTRARAADPQGAPAAVLPGARRRPSPRARGTLRMIVAPWDQGVVATPVVSGSTVAGHALGGGVPAQGLAGSGVEFGGDRGEVFGGVERRGRCPWGSTGAAARWCSRCCRVARGSGGRRSRPAGPAATVISVWRAISLPWSQVSDRRSARAGCPSW